MHTYKYTDLTISLEMITLNIRVTGLIKNNQKVGLSKILNFNQY